MKKPKKKITLRVFLSSAFLIFAFILIAFMWVFQTVLLEPFYRAVKTLQVESCAHSIADSVSEEDFNNTVSEIEEQNNMKVHVYDTTNEIFSCVYASNRSFLKPTDQMDMSTIYRYYDETVKNGGETKFKTTKGEDKDFKFNDFDKPDKDSDHKHGLVAPLEKEKSEDLAFAKIVNYEDKEYFIIVESEITPLNSTIETLRIQLAIITTLIIAISFVIALVSAYLISKPIKKTNDIAKQLAFQNYDLDFQPVMYKELDELNGTLSYSANELRKVDNLKKELIANISHDLRTPLTMITGYSEVMRDIPGENSPENIQIIIDEAKRLSNLVNNLLDISKLEAGSTTFDDKAFDLTACIENIFIRYTQLVKQDGYNLIFEYDAPVYINADELRISQVMYNLINNAINYCGDDKTIIVRQTVFDNTVCIEVIDHGKGIPDDKLPYIWDRYYKVDKEHKQAVVGTGLGLSIVKNILNHYNSEYGVKTILDKGSDFWWKFEICDQNIDID